MPTAGQLRERVTFQSRGTVADDYGNEVTGAFADQFTVAARVWPRVGNEAVMAAKLEGRQPVTIQVRHSSQTAQIKADWRAVNARSGEVYAITAPPVNVDERRQFLDITAVIGEAA